MKRKPAKKFAKQRASKSAKRTATATKRRPERGDTESARAALRSVDAQWAQTPPDVERFVSFFAEDGTFLPPNAPAAKGKEAIRAFVSELVTRPGFAVNWQATEAGVSGAGDLGYTLGRYELRLNDPDGKPLTDRGKYVTVWKKQVEGAWKVVADIFNSDLPPAAPA
jgi:ketosteroid isomerase-like protein